MGMGETDPFTLFSLTEDLEQIERNYARQIAISVRRPARDLVHRYRKKITKLLADHKKIGSDFFANEIEKAGWSMHKPHADDSTLNMLMEEHRQERKDMAATLTAHGLDVDHWLKTSGDAATYRKREVRKLVVEPFLQLMAEHGITTSRKLRPRKTIFDALFDWVGVPRTLRPSSVNIDKIARETKRPEEPL